MIPRHIPVLMNHVLDALAPQPGHVLVDCTVGLGGHSSVLLRRITPGGTLLGIDLDPKNLELAREQLERAARPSTQQGRADYQLFNTNFAGLPRVLADAGFEKVNGIVADLGVASPQIDDPERGFSYRRPGPLDMRMDPSRGKPASHLVNTLSREELAEALLELGDEDDAERIAELIVHYRQHEPIQTTQRLTEIVCEARHFTLERAAGAKLHPAARTFQALRILVNRELANLDRLLAVLPDVLLPGGVAAIISFHSGEDRRVKQAFKMGLNDEVYSQISPDPLTADLAEQKVNSRARSAKMRWARANS